MSKLKIIVIFIILSNDYQLNLVASSSGEHLFIDIVFEYIGIYYNRIFYSANVWISVQQYEKQCYLNDNIIEVSIV